MEDGIMSTESFTNTVVIKEDGFKCFCEILEKGKDYKEERKSGIPDGDLDKIAYYLKNHLY